MLAMPDETPLHSLHAVMEMAGLARQAQVTAWPWEEEAGLKSLTINQAREFLKAHEVAGVA